MTPVYDVERFGVVNTADPMQADILLVTGGVNSQSAEVVKQLYDQMARPKVELRSASAPAPAACSRTATTSTVVSTQ